MLRSLTLVLMGALAHGAIFPDTLGPLKRGPAQTVRVPDQALYDEFGLEAAEQAEFTSPGKHITATAWRMHDSTGAMALFESRRPAGATPADVTKLSARTKDGMTFAYGNYVFQFAGGVPATADLQALYGQLPKLEQSALPVLMTYLPPEGLIPNSERYILGPVSLQQNEPRIPPAVAAFHLGSEGQLGRYRTAKGPLTLAIFSYPTPGMARERHLEYQKIPGVIAKRTGPLVAVAVNPPDLDAAERILAKVRYETNLTWNEKVPVNEAKGLATMILDIFTFTGILLALCVVAGIGFGGIRIVARRMGWKEGSGSMITLHLGNK